MPRSSLLAPFRLPAPHILEELSNLVLDNLRKSGVFSSALVACLAVASLSLLFDLTASLYWLLGIQLLNLLTYWALLAEPRWRLDSLGKHRLLLAVFASAGIGWGLLPLFVTGGSSPIPLLFATTVITVHCVGTFGLTTSSMGLSCSYMYPAMLPLVTLYFLQEDPLFLSMGLVCVVYLLCMTVFAAQAQQQARQAVLLRFESEALAERLRLESQRLEQAKAEAEQANQDKSRFLAAASHDLRQPLHALGLFLDALSRMPLAGRQADMLDNAITVAGSTRDMLDSLLEFSRLDAGVVGVHPRPFRLQPLLCKLEVEMAPLAEAKGLVYRTRDCHWALFSDPALVEQVLRNLLTNAIRYTQSGGVLVAARPRGSRLWLEVWDTGIGIAPAEQQQVFREFYQLNNPERDRSKGLGLGLAIVRGLCHTLGCELLLDSRPGFGSRFRLSLPLAKTVVVEEPGAVPLPSRSFDGLKVLVVDDDAPVRLAMAALLEGWGCDCRLAGDEQQALALGTERPQLLIVDYRLRQGRNGGQVIAALAEKFGGGSPAIIITGDTAPDRLREAQATGALLLHKPVAADKLYQAMQQALAAG
ncbi:ATP-binding response regulator [Zobellella sp. An-6]|uniref:ATP-binding response regulator n=1 Tax=Zobellella sp. An-6 TaxID=3400218 RepID=UPI004041B753